MITDHIEEIKKPLLSWFQEHARELPWREQPLPYYVWVSEIMLQQTRVEAVKPYFARFIKALPDIKALADCGEDRLLKLWEGLGYYNRVRNMQKAARIVMEQYGGCLPADYRKLLELPGIGSYTAGAIASIAFHIPVPAVDGNVLRVISRITENEEDILKPSVKRRMEEMLQEVMPREEPGVFNQALMELGALICLPGGAPDCPACPLKQLCMARRHGRERELPVRSKKQARQLQEKTVLVIGDGTRTVIRKRPPKGLLAGLYELPNLSGHLSEDQAVSYLKEKGFSPLRILPLPGARHIFSHVEWNMIGHAVLVEDMEEREAGGEFLAVEPERTRREYPIPSAFGAYADWLFMRTETENTKMRRKK